MEILLLIIALILFVEFFGFAPLLWLIAGLIAGFIALFMVAAIFQGVGAIFQGIRNMPQSRKEPEKQKISEEEMQEKRKKYEATIDRHLKPYKTFFLTVFTWASIELDALFS